MSRGLRFRLKRAARQTAEQHAHIHEILRDFEEAVAERDRERLVEVFSLYRSALAAHFQLEEEVFFPALHGLHPEHAEELEDLASQHIDMAADLDELGARVETAPIEALARQLRALVAVMARHEQREELLVKALMRAPEPGGPPEPGGREPSPSRSGV